MKKVNIKNDREALEHVFSSLINQGEKCMDTLIDECRYRAVPELELPNALSDAFSKMNRDLKGFNSFGDVLDKYTDGYSHADDEEYFNALEIISDAFSYIYNHPDDFSLMKCAVGHLINDDKYLESMESNTIIEEVVINGVSESNPDWKINDNSIEMLTYLQTMHDISKSPKTWVDIYNHKDVFFHFNEDGSFNIEKSVVITRRIIETIEAANGVENTVGLFDGRAYKS